jgi:hypothetical protein
LYYQERRLPNAETTESRQTCRTADGAANVPKETLTPFLEAEARFSDFRTGLPHPIFN